MSPTLELCNPIDNFHLEGTLSQISHLGPSFCFMSKKRETFVGYMYRKCQLSIYHSKRDIDIKKIKVEIAIFVRIFGFVTCFSYYQFL